MKQRLTALLLALTLILTLAACGGTPKESPYAGTYTSVCGKAMGVTLTGDDIAGFTIVLGNGGKGHIDFQGDGGDVKWTVEENKLTIKADGEEITGTVGEDTFFFEDMLGQGVDLTFAREGSDAANPELYLSEEEKAMLGSWKSISVANILGDDAASDTAPDGLEMTITADHKVTIRRNGEDLEPQSWMYFSGSVYLDNNMSWEVKNGQLIVDYYAGDDYFVYTCEK